MSLRPSPFWDIMWRRLAVGCWRFGTTCRSSLRKSSSSRRLPVTGRCVLIYGTVWAVTRPSGEYGSQPACWNVKLPLGREGKLKMHKRKGRRQSKSGYRRNERGRGTNHFLYCIHLYPVVFSDCLWPLNIGSIGFPETSVTNYKLRSLNIPEERWPRLFTCHLNSQRSVLWALEISVTWSGCAE